MCMGSKSRDRWWAVTTVRYGTPVTSDHDMSAGFGMNGTREWTVAKQLYGCWDLRRFWWRRMHCWPQLCLWSLCGNESVAEVEVKVLSTMIPTLLIPIYTDDSSMATQTGYIVPTWSAIWGSISRIIKTWPHVFRESRMQPRIKNDSYFLRGLKCISPRQ